MTTPGQGLPADAIGGGDVSALDGLSEATWRNNINGQVIGSYNDAHVALLAPVNDLQAQIDIANDRQLDLNDRTDLLEDAPAYGQLFLGNSWNLGSGRKTLPFDSWIGPHKDVTKYQNGLRLQRKGLWRADLQIGFDPPPSNWFTGGVVVVVNVFLCVRTLSGGLHTQRQYDFQVSSLGAQSAAFPVTFVIPDDDAYYVRAEVQHNKSSIRLRGGTVQSSLSVNKWENGTSNPANIPDPPLGGTL